jgi:hypothetical protein
LAPGNGINQMEHFVSMLIEFDSDPEYQTAPAHALVWFPAEICLEEAEEFIKALIFNCKSPNLRFALDLGVSNWDFYSNVGDCDFEA